MDLIMGLNSPDINTPTVHSNEKSIVKPTLFLSEASAKDKKWDEHRANAEKVGDLYDLNPRFAKYAAKIEECSTYLQFAEKISPETGEIGLKLGRASFCRLRQCPVCAWRKSLRNTARFFEKIPDIKKEFPTARFLFLTLTVPNCRPEKLRAKLSEMNKGWKRLIETKSWPALGFVRTVEVTRSKKGEAHPHFHALLMVPASYFSRGYIAQASWLEMWQKAMRDDSITQVDIRTVKPKIEGQELHAAVVETLKYSTKVTDAFEDPAWLYHMTDQLRGLRFIASGGVLKDILKDEVTEEEMITPEGDQLSAEETQRKLMFTWRKEHKKYAFKKAVT